MMVREAGKHQSEANKQVKVYMTDFFLFARENFHNVLIRIAKQLFR